MTLNGAVVEVVCPAGCSKCNLGEGNKIVCTEPDQGYAFDIDGNIVRCSDTCATCSATDATACTSCYGSSQLSGTSCVGCQDANAVSCAGNTNWADKCIEGYSPVNGKCEACAEYCLSCGVAGAGKCDATGCAPGFVVLTGTTNCTLCFNGCASCSTRNPSSCESCVPGEYLTSESKCTACPSVCLACTSATVCTSCISGYFLASGTCYEIIPFPCSAQTQNSCTKCYYGYLFSNGQCTLDSSCNGTSTCLSCSKNYYLSSGKCLACTTNAAVCDYCKDSDPAVCQQCTTGYYLSGTTCTTCVSAMTGCTRCKSKFFCTKTGDGYFLEKKSGAFTGKAKACKSTCATCVGFPACQSCVTTYVKIGAACIY